MKSCWALAAIGALTACFSPKYPDGLACGDGASQCPPGQTCGADNRCHANGTDAALDDADVPSEMMFFDGPPTDVDESCVCSGNTLMCAGGSQACELGCVADPTARCMVVVPANGVTLDGLDVLTTEIVVDSGVATFDLGRAR